MILCDFQLIQGTDCDYKCSRCGLAVANIPAEILPLQAVCRAAMQGPPPDWKKAINFAKAVFSQAPLVGKWLWTGDESKAFRNETEIKAIADACNQCPLFNGQVCTHQNCGCAIDEERSAWWSKIAWRSQQCPDDPPRWK